MKLLDSLKEKVQFLKSFDSEIDSKKKELENSTKASVLKDAKLLLEEYSERAKIETDVKALEQMKEQFMKPDVLNELAEELLSETSYAYDELKEISEECEKAKQEYIEKLRVLDKQHEKLMGELEAKRKQYEDVCCELGHSWHVARSKLHIPISASPAEYTSREKIYL